MQTDLSDPPLSAFDPDPWCYSIPFIAECASNQTERSAREATRLAAHST